MTRERAAALLAEGETDLAEAKRQQHREWVETLELLVAERRARFDDLHRSHEFAVRFANAVEGLKG